jgi:hypothetical protein
MIERGVVYVETSAHMGARNKDVEGKPWANHEKWQGRVFYWKEMDKGGADPDESQEPAKLPVDNSPDMEYNNSTGGGNVADVQAERRKILDGTYPTKVIAGRQRKHIEGTREFEQKRAQMQKDSPGSEPAILTADAQALVDQYKGTGSIRITRGSNYPQETVIASAIIGKTWVNSLQKYVDTRGFRIIYSSKGVHIFPVNDK